jgi:CHAT domain-containing protein
LAASLDAAVETKSEERRGRIEEEFESLAKRLGNVLLPEPIRNRISRETDLFVVPHGAIGLLSFAVLPADGSGTPLGSKMAIRYSPSLEAVIAAEARAGRASLTASRISFSSAVVAGNPEMPRLPTAAGVSILLEPLPGAEDEARSIARRLGSVPLTGLAATESAVRANLSRASLLHFATHGLAYSSEAKARDSFIALAADSTHDGLLTVGELMDDPRLSVSAELVVLSACQTGLGNLRQAEGTVGLQRAFLARGERSVLVTLWSVDDRSTALIMDRFYAHWLNGRERPSKAEALRRAQADVRATPGHEHPRHWAAFQLVGAR